MSTVELKAAVGRFLVETSGWGYLTVPLQYSYCDTNVLLRVDTVPNIPPNSLALHNYFF